MKVCPKCNSTYSDETLNFCLTDGIPLVENEAKSQSLSENWQDAETIFDPNLKIHQPQPHITSPNNTSDTSPKIKVKTDSFSVAEVNKSRPYLFPLIGVLLTIGVIGGIFWWLYANPDNSSANKQNLTETHSSNAKKAIVKLNADQENQVKKEVPEFLEVWRVSNEKKDIETHIANYANTLDIYYDKSGVDRNIVRSDRLRAYQRYDSISLQLDNIKITPESSESASVIFDKTWIMKSVQKTSTGSVQQEMRLSKQNGKWLISGEKDLKVYYINNRENTLANADQNSQNTNQ